jgi:hypothetical protein
MNDRGELGVAAVCCLLHSLVPGGSTWQWIRLLKRHVARGGRATIFAADGPLAGPARAAEIEVVPTAWGEGGPHGGIWRTAAAHDVAIVQWEQGVTDVFPRALDACGHAALAMHELPQTMTRRFAPPTPMKARRAVEWAVSEPRVAVLVRGEAHRRKVAAAYAVPREELSVLPPSASLASLPFDAAGEDLDEVLAMTRLAPGKMSIVHVAVELVRQGLSAGRSCRLTIAGDGIERPHAIALCERRLPAERWRIENAPDDPTARLAATDVVVAQGTTTLEAAALGRRVVVARSLGARAASATVLTPDRYDEAARDPFGDPPVSEDAAQLWDELLGLDSADLVALRRLVERHNSIEATEHALDEALTATEIRT